ncbi:hypothetical protein H1R20_g12026, partial [Candolleomyces eurysporus]
MRAPNRRPLEKFFKKYSRSFTYDYTEPATSEFQRLCEAVRWYPNSPKQQAAYEEFRDALVMEFNKNYGTNANDLKSWQKLCAAVRMDPIPNNLAEAKKAMLGVHVNLVDLTCVANPSGIRLFPTEKALTEYTLRTQKIFPMGNVYCGALLRELLRHIFSEPTRVERRRESVSYRRSRHTLQGVPWDDESEYGESEDDESEYGEWKWKYGEPEYDDLEDDEDCMKGDNDPYPMPAMHDFDWFVDY